MITTRLDPERVEVICADLLELSLPKPLDAAISTATFHWISDHDALFARIRAGLRPGAPFVAQCGGEGNIDRVRTRAAAITTRAPHAPHFAGSSGRWYHPSVARTRAALERAGAAGSNRPGSSRRGRASSSRQ